MADESKELAIIGIDESGEPTVREPIILNLSAFRNAKFLDIRKYYKDGENWKPTKKGIALNGEQLDEILKIIEEKKKEIKDWLDEE